ncbi:MAG TPA: sugar phosphate isomerase/epimerase [Candidatus Limnocylindrales bacterium]|nr:sugar phosphate isomerase/epimerase [Candidatus Limnocylindrales bacterium]
MNVRLGINTCFAVKRWPRPADWARVVRDDLGLDLVELSLDLLEGFETPEGLQRVAAENRAAIDEAGLRAVGTFTGLIGYSRNLLLHPDPAARAAALGWYESVIDLTAELGLAGTGGHVGALSAPDWLDPAARAARWADLKTSLASLSARARASGLEHFLVENLVPVREPSTMAQVADLLTPGDAGHVPVGVCVDLGHMCVDGQTGLERDPYAWLARFGAELLEVQLQQSDAEGDHHWAFTPERNRQGRIEAGRVLDTLDAAGARDVTLILEMIPGFEERDDQLRADLAASAAYWRAAIDAHGSSPAVRA